MNWLVGLDPALKRTSLILIGNAFRTRAVVVSDCVLRSQFVHSALPVTKPAPVRGGAVILKVAVTLAPGATLPSEAFDARTVHPAGAEMLNLTPDTGAPVVFVNVAVRSWADLGVNVMTRD